jgi:hypothetical protein
MRMPRVRFTIIGLMAAVLACGVALAAFRDTSDFWGGAMLLATAVTLGAATLGARHARAADRAWWRGFALFGWGYLIATMGPWFAEEIGPKLPTTFALDRLQHLAVGPPERVVLQGNVSGSVSGTTFKADKMMLDYGGGRRTQVDARGGGVSAAMARLMTTALPGAINREAFLRVGHCLFAMLTAALGAAIAGRFHRSSDVAPGGPVAFLSTQPLLDESATSRL